MSWRPNPTVTLAGSDVSGSAVGRVSVRRGRDSVYASPNAGYASVELLDASGAGLPVEVGQTLGVAVDDSSGSPVMVFSGLVSDWELGVLQTASGVPVVVYRLQAVGPLARMNRRQTLAGGRPAELDGARVAAAIGAGLGTSWEEAGFYSWDSVGTAVTWATFDPGVDLSLVDPGVYDLAALGTADGGYSALSVAQEAGFSASGVLFETATGFIGYADADRRPSNAAAGFLEVPLAEVAADSLRVSSSLADVTNRVVVEYPTGVETVDDTWSITTYGVQASTFQTVLEDATSANIWADDYLLRHASPQRELQQLRVNLVGAGTALRDALLDVNTNAAVELTGIPAAVGLGNTFRGFVEGVEIVADPFAAEIGLLVSAEALSQGGTRWGQVSATLVWSAVGSAVTWSDFDG